MDLIPGRKIGVSAERQQQPDLPSSLADRITEQPEIAAAIDLGIGEALGKAVSPHTSAEFDAFLTDAVVNQPHGKEIFAVADDVSAHTVH